MESEEKTEEILHGSLMKKHMDSIQEDDNWLFPNVVVAVILTTGSILEDKR